MIIFLNTNQNHHDMRALVTGGTGFVGSNIAEFLLQKGYDVVITGKENEQNVKGLKNDIVFGHIADIDWDRLGKFDVIFHEAAITDTLMDDEKEMLRTNLEASKRLFEFARKTGCKRIIYASSTAVYGDVAPPYKEEGPLNPLNAYARSKLMLDEFAQKFWKDNPDIVVVGLRYCNVYGPGEDHKGRMSSMIYQLAQQMKKGNPRIFKWGEQKRDHIYVKDVVRANMLASEAHKSCIVNCAPGHAVTFNEVIEVLNDITGLNRKTEYFDNPYEGRYQNHTECDMSLAEQKISFKTKYSLRDGIKDYYESGKLIG